jgi:pimeloyl-ACP methyl ester carboxylesterase
MQPFALTLENKASLSGLCNIPDDENGLVTYRPLVVALHGATYTSEYFDVDAKHSAALQSNALKVPFVAIDRPGYGNSTSFHPISEDSSYPELYDEWLHKYILPAIWKQFGIPQKCNTIILHCHSLGTTGAVIAAALHAREELERTDDTSLREKAKEDVSQYPLGGIIVSGFGTQLINKEFHIANIDEPPKEINFSSDVKNQMMLPPGTARLEVYGYTSRLNNPCPFDEVHTIWSTWVPRVRTEWAPQVKVPIMIGIAEKDCFWKGTDEHADDFASIFTASTHVDANVIKRAPHNLEMSYWSQGWYARSFGFALECAISFSILT